MGDKMETVRQELTKLYQNRDISFNEELEKLISGGCEPTAAKDFLMKALHTPSCSDDDVFIVKGIPVQIRNRVGMTPIVLRVNGLPPASIGTEQKLPPSIVMLEKRKM
jgi:hypothetical protein